MVIVLLFLFLVALSYFTPRNYFSWCTNLFSPVIKSVKTFSLETGKIFSIIINSRKLARERQNYEIEIQKLKREIYNSREISIENSRLRQLLHFKEEIPYETIPAKVVGRDATNWYKSILIDKGKQNGIAIDMPVVSYGGVVGKIIEVTDFNAMVILITDKQSKIGGIVQETRYVGIVEGTAKHFLSYEISF
ncbi:rod shape-determining protein MreC [Candidatus Auribacterota bacterium]